MLFPSSLLAQLLHGCLLGPLLLAALLALCTAVWLHSPSNRNALVNFDRHLNALF